MKTTWLQLVHQRLFAPRPNVKRPRRPHRARLSTESLESKDLLATFVVSSLADAGPDTLRQAVLDANAGGDPVDDIDFQAGLSGTINLTGGEIAIESSLNINGPGSGVITIDANGNSRVFNVDDGDANNLIDVEIVGLTLTGGNVIGSGGGIQVRENFVLRDSVLSGNSSTNGGGGLNAAANANLLGSMSTLLVENSQFTNNYAGFQGGGIHVDSDAFGDNSSVRVEIRDTTIADNVAGPFGDGGGIHLDSDGNGPGAYTSTLLERVTITGNVSDDDGGGIQSDIDANDPDSDVVLKILDSEISGNTAGVNSSYGEGGGIELDNDGNDSNTTVTVIIRNTTISGNTANHEGGGIEADDDANDPFASVSLLIEDSEISGNTVTGINAPYGGAGGGFYADNDANDSDTSVSISIRRTTITGNSGIEDGGGVWLNNDANDSRATVNVLLDEVTITNNDAGRDGGGIYTDDDANDPDSTATLTITNSTISGNSAMTGGGIYSEMRLDPTATQAGILIENSTISGNTSATSGGGIYQNHSDASFAVENSTISGNMANGGSGGGIFNNQGTLSITHGTLTDNSATASGGGIAMAAGQTATLRNAIVAVNTAGADPDLNNGGATFDAAFSLIGDVGTATIIDSGNNQIGGNGNPVINPLLGPLQNNGGPTFTHALTFGSPALNTGNEQGIFVDQRGETRPSGPQADIGAFETAHLKDVVVDVSPQLIREGESVALTGSFENLPQIHTVTINWGDNTLTTFDLLPGDPNPQSFNVQHQYVDDDPSGTPQDEYNIVVQVEDSSGGSALDDSAFVTVKNVSPFFLTLDLTPTTVNAGGSVNVSGTFDDVALAEESFGIDVDLNGDGVFDIVDVTEVTVNGVGSFNFDLPFNLPAGSYDVGVRIRDDDGGATVASRSITITNPVEGVHLFYNNSAYDGNGAVVTAADFVAIATDKTALLLGGTGSFANISSYNKGLNGFFIDVQNLPNNGAGIDAADFMFMVGNDNFPDAWPNAPVPTAVDVLPGQGENGSDRIFITFADGAIQKTWLRIVVKANGDTGLLAEQSFFFGSAPGETGNNPQPDEVNVDAFDFAAVAVNLTPTGNQGTEPVTQIADITRDATVDALDFLAIAVNLANEVIDLITPQAGVPGSAPSGESLHRELAFASFADGAYALASLRQLGDTRGLEAGSRTLAPIGTTSDGRVADRLAQPTPIRSAHQIALDRLVDSHRPLTVFDGNLDAVNLLYDVSRLDL